MPNNDKPELNNASETITHEGVGDETNNTNNTAPEELSPNNNDHSSTLNGHPDSNAVDSNVTLVINGPDKPAVEEPDTITTPDDKPANEEDPVNVLHDVGDDKPIMDEGGDKLPPPPPPPPFVIEEPRPEGESEPHNVVVNVDDANFSPDEALITNIDEVLDLPEQDMGGSPTPISPPPDIDVSKQVYSFPSLH